MPLPTSGTWMKARQSARIGIPATSPPLATCSRWLASRLCQRTAARTSPASAARARRMRRVVERCFPEIVKEVTFLAECVLRGGEIPVFELRVCAYPVLQALAQIVVASPHIADEEGLAILADLSKRISARPDFGEGLIECRRRKGMRTEQAGISHSIVLPYCVTTPPSYSWFVPA